jgi:hypothetical protein
MKHVLWCSTCNKFVSAKRRAIEGPPKTKCDCGRPFASLGTGNEGIARAESIRRMQAERAHRGAQIVGHVQL